MSEAALDDVSRWHLTAFSTSIIMAIFYLLQYISTLLTACLIFIPSRWLRRAACASSTIIAMILKVVVSSQCWNFGIRHFAACLEVISQHSRCLDFYFVSHYMESDFTDNNLFGNLIKYHRTLLIVISQFLIALRIEHELMILSP